MLLLLLLIWDHKELGSEHIGQIMIQASRVRLGNGSVRYASAIRPSKMEVRSLGFSAYTIGRVKNDCQAATNQIPQCYQKEIWFSSSMVSYTDNNLPLACAREPAVISVATLECASTCWRSMLGPECLAW